MDFTPYIGAVVSAAIFIIGSYVAMKNANNEKFNELSVQIATLTAEVKDLRRDVEKHNNVVERTAGLERDLHTAFKRIDELKEDDEKIAQKIERLHE